MLIYKIVIWLVIDLSGADLSGTIFTGAKMGITLDGEYGPIIDRASMGIQNNNIHDISNQFLDVETRTGRAYSLVTNDQTDHQFLI